MDCDKTFGTFNSFKSHCLESHNMFPLECDICKRRYKEQATFKNHMETHQGLLKYECDICSKKFVTKERLFAHRRLHLGKRQGFVGLFSVHTFQKLIVNVLKTISKIKWLNFNSYNLLQTIFRGARKSIYHDL